MAVNYRPITPTSYVAFTKATEEIWGKMDPSQRLDNTLYFIVDGVDDEVGKLYLGNALIADGNGLTSLALGDLSDVTYGLMQHGDILMFDMADNTWKNTNFAAEIGNLIKVFEGATAEKNGLAGLVPQPVSANNDFDKYLKGDGTWSNPTEAVEASVLHLQGQVSTLIGSDNDRSVRSIATDIATKIAGDYYNQILNNAPETLDTLGEIAAWIETHPDLDDIVQLIQRVGTLETDVSTLKPQVEGLETNLGKLTETVSGLKLNFETLETNHNNLNALVLQIQASVKGNTDDIADLYTRLAWQELYEEE